MVTYALGIVLIVGWYLVSSPGEPPAERATVPLAELDVPDDDREPRAKIDRELLAAVVRDETRADRALIEPEARAHLLGEAGKLIYGDLDKLGLAPADWDALAADPTPRRGDAVWTLGRLQWTDAETIDRLPSVRGEIVDAEGRPWTFLVLAEPLDLEPDEVVYVSGFFMKMYDALRPDGRFVTAPLIVGEELLRSAFRIDPVTELRPGLFDRVRDYDIGQASAPLESPEFYEALSYVDNADTDELFPPDEPVAEVMPIELLGDPAVWRGELVQATGVLLYMRQAPLGPRGQNPLGVPQHWQLWISDYRSGGAGTLLALSLDKPPVAERDIVDVRGLFFRRLAFETKRQEAKMAAVVLAADVTRYVPPEDTLTPAIMKVIVGLVFGLVLLLVIGQWRERRGALVERSRRLQRKRKLVGRERDEGPKDPPVIEPGDAAGEPSSA